MKNLRKVLVVAFLVSAFTLSSAKVHGIEVSIGTSTSLLDYSIIRGSDANEFASSLSDFSTDKLFRSIDISFDVMIEFLPFLALETGIGYSYIPTLGEPLDINFPDGFPFHGEVEVIGGGGLFRKNGFTIPIMLRFQHELKRALFYISVGPKFFIPIVKYVDKSELKYPDGYFKENNFILDLALAFGTEFRVGSANYLGFRLGYDVNLISPFKSIGREDDPEFYHDSASLSFTYRYAFGSKWKK